MTVTDLFNLKGKTAIVTGCSRGIGQSMAIGLAEAGADIIGVSSSLKEGSEVGKAITALGRNFKPYSVDFSNRQSLYDFVSQVNKNHPPVDILVNNAGTIMRNPAAQHSDDYWDKVLTINLDSQFILAREFGKQ